MFRRMRGGQELLEGKRAECEVGGEAGHRLSF